MLTQVLFVCALLIKFIRGEGNCGLQFNSKIIGGSESEPNSWPWMASIHYNFKHVCGGTLINDQFILTAAHCFEFSLVSPYKVILGAHNISQMGIGTKAERYDVDKIIKHERYIGDQTYDIALIKLTKPVQFKSTIFPICLPAKTDSFEDTKVVFAGWGYARPGGALQSTLREVNMVIMNKQECLKYSSASPEHKYCSFNNNPVQDTCQGDSGGPGMWLNSKTRQWYIAGVVSYGVNECGSVGINTRVDYFRDWIDEKIEQNRLF